MRCLKETKIRIIEGIYDIIIATFFSSVASLTGNQFLEVSGALNLRLVYKGYRVQVLFQHNF